MPGMDIVERMAMENLPLSQYFAVPLTSSVAAHENGIGRSEKFISSW